VERGFANELRETIKDLNLPIKILVHPSEKKLNSIDELSVNFNTPLFVIFEDCESPKQIFLNSFVIPLGLSEEALCLDTIEYIVIASFPSINFSQNKSPSDLKKLILFWSSFLTERYSLASLLLNTIEKIFPEHDEVWKYSRSILDCLLGRIKLVKQKPSGEYTSIPPVFITGEIENFLSSEEFILSEFLKEMPAFEIFYALWLLFYKEEAEKGLEVINKWITENETHPLLWVAYLNRAIIKQKLNLIDEAIKDCEKSWEIYPHYPNLSPKILANIWMQLGNYEKALEALNRAEDSLGVSVIGTKISLFRRLHKFEEALKLRNQIDSRYQNCLPLLYNFGNLLAEMENFDDALYYYKKAWQINSSQPKLNYYIGIIFSNKELYDSALLYFNNEIKHNPDYPRTYCAKGELLILLKQEEEGIENIKKSIERGFIPVASIQMIEDTLFIRGKYTLLYDFLQFAFLHRVYDSLPSLLGDGIVLALMNGDTSRALKYFEFWSRITYPTNYRYFVVLSYFKLIEKNYEEFEKILGFAQKVFRLVTTYSQKSLNITSKTWVSAPLRHLLDQIEKEVRQGDYPGNPAFVYQVCEEIKKAGLSGE
jgi:tetratricopeptide (TPR) repeat protein